MEDSSISEAVRLSDIGKMWSPFSKALADIRQVGDKSDGASTRSGDKNNDFPGEKESLAVTSGNTEQLLAASVSRNVFKLQATPVTRTRAR